MSIRARRGARRADRNRRPTTTPAAAHRLPAERPCRLPDWVEPEALEDDGHYVPPPPPPVPRLSPRKLAAALTLVAGLLLMFAPGLLLQPRTAGVGVLRRAPHDRGCRCSDLVDARCPAERQRSDDGAVVWTRPTSCDGSS